MSVIKDVAGLEIIDSRGNPTVEAEVVLASGARGRAAVPSGASTGSREAHELRDGDRKRYVGKGVRKAVAHVDGEIRKAVVGIDAADQQKLDRKMIEVDGTPIQLGYQSVRLWRAVMYGPAAVMRGPSNRPARITGSTPAPVSATLRRSRSAP